jgi:hypothetical protein
MGAFCYFSNQTIDTSQQAVSAASIQISDQSFENFSI